jgi:hypothetical protein
MRLCLINPSNPLVSILDVGESRWNRFRVWKPLGLMVIAGLTPDDWEITIIPHPIWSALLRSLRRLVERTSSPLAFGATALP